MMMIDVTEKKYLFEESDYCQIFTVTFFLIKFIVSVLFVVCPIESHLKLL